MNKKEIEQFEAYYHDRMSKEERMGFKQRLTSEPALANAYRKYQIMVKAGKATSSENIIQAYRLKKHQEDMQVLVPLERDETKNKKTTSTKVIPVFSRKNLRWTAAASILLISLSLFLLRNQFIDIEKLIALTDNRVDNQELAQQLWMNRPRGYAATLELYSGLRAFDEEKYMLAVKDLSAYIADKPSARLDTAYYFLGESYRALNDLGSALSSFQKVADQSSLYNHKYLSVALTYLSMEQKRAARESAEKVLLNQKDRTYHDKASKIIEKLKYGFFSP